MMRTDMRTGKEPAGERMAHRTTNGGHPPARGHTGERGKRVGATGERTGKIGLKVYLSTPIIPRCVTAGGDGV